MESYESTFRSQVISGWESHYLNYSTLNKLRKKLQREFEGFVHANKSKLHSIDSNVSDTNSMISDVSETSSIEVSRGKKYSTFEYIEEKLPCVKQFVEQFVGETQRIQDFYKLTFESLVKRLEILNDQTQRYLNDLTPSESMEEGRNGGVDTASKSANADSSLFQTSVRMNSEEEIDLVSSISFSVVQKGNVDHRKESIQNTFVDIYRNTMFLQSYVEINRAALQRFVQEVPIRKTRADLRKNLYDKEFSAKGIQECLKLCETVEILFAKFKVSVKNKAQRESGSFESLSHLTETPLDVMEARAALLAKQSPTLKFPDVAFGFRLGIAFTLFIWLMWDAVMQASIGRINIMATAGFPLIRAAGCLVLAYWGWTISFMVWTQNRINWMYIFKLNPGLVRPYTDMIYDATNMSIVVALTSILYYKTVTASMPLVLAPPYYLVACWFYLLIKFLFKPRVAIHHIFAPLSLAVIAPFSEVTFYSTYVADWMTSLVRVEVDIAYGMCYFATANYNGSMEDVAGCRESHVFKYYITPIICILPLYFRFMQCIRRIYDTNHYRPHILNCIKYGLAQSVLLFGLFHPPNKSDLYNSFWFVLFSFSSIYAFVWDVVFDWGLGDIQCGFLSNRRMYPKKSLYYVAIIMDLILRHSWLLNFIPPETRFFLFKEIPPVVVFLITPTLILILEIIRRTFWSFFRLENEHLRNTQEFHNNEVIPLHFEGVCNDGLQEEQNSGVGKALELFAIVSLTGYVLYRCIAW